jgi:osmotically-inducible protein OsmY
MNTKLNRTHKSFFALAVATALISGCTTDNEIKADIAAKAKNDLNFAAVGYTVDNRIITLTGNCPSLKSRQQVLQTVKGINVAKSVVNRIQIAPVILDQELSIKQAADSILAAYPGVTASVKEGQLVLSGKASTQENAKLTEAMSRLPGLSVDNRLQATQKE